MQLARIILALLALAHVTPAVAENDKTPPGQSAAPGNAGSANAGVGNTNQPMAEKPPKANANQNKGNGVLADPPTPLSDDQDEALRAVEAHEALPLARIVAIAEATAGVHVVDARLVRIDNVLLYQLTLLNDDGRSWRAYYLARSGNPVAIN